MGAATPVGENEYHKRSCYPKSMHTNFIKELQVYSFIATYLCSDLLRWPTGNSTRQWTAQPDVASLFQCVPREVL